jgi:hypothetical protein
MDTVAKYYSVPYGLSIVLPHSENEITSHKSWVKCDKIGIYNPFVDIHDGIYYYESNYKMGGEKVRIVYEHKLIYIGYFIHYSYEYVSRLGLSLINFKLEDNKWFGLKPDKMFYFTTPMIVF